MSRQPPQSPQQRVVGRVVKPHGLRGEVVVEVRTDEPERRFAQGAAVRARVGDGENRCLTIVGARWHARRLLVRFDGVADPEAAERLRAAMLTVWPHEGAGGGEELDDDEFYDHQLEGLSVSTVDGVALGTVREVMHGHGGELLVVARHDGGEALIPFVRQIVPAIDLGAGTVVVDPPEGLLDL